MGFPGHSSDDVVFPIAILRIAILSMFVKQSFISVVNYLLGRGWGSPSSRMYTLVEQSVVRYCSLESALDTVQLAAEMKASLPVVRHGEIAKKFANDGDALCSVCLCDLTCEDGVRQAPRCSHVFYKDCLDRWMARSQTTCPLCRSILVTNCQPEQQRKATGARRSLWEFWDGYPSISTGVH